MKQTATFVFLLCLCGWAFAQHWRPLTANEHFHYQADTAHYISHVMLADSVTLDGADSVFHLNRITAPCDTCVYYAGAILINQPQFLLRTATQRTGGMWEFRDGADGFVLHTQALAGTSWPFHVGGSDTAVVVSADTATTFGAPDSVKRIAVGADTIVLSQQYGVLHFPAIDDSLAYTLVGIDSGRTVGVRMPSPLEYYDFQVGDVFVSASWDVECHPCSGFSHRYKTIVLSRTDSPDSIRYVMRQLSREDSPHCYPYPCGGSQDTIISYISPLDRLETPLPNAFYGYTPLRIWKDADGRVQISNSPGYLTELSGGFVPRQPLKYLSGNDQSWMLLPANLAVPEDTFNAFHTEAYATGFGTLASTDSRFESSRGYALNAYVRNGIEYGYIPDDIYFTGIAPEAGSEFTLAPNPANTHVVLTLTSDARPGTAALLDLQGREIRQTAVAGGTARLETADLPAGLYLLRVQTDTGTATPKVMIQH